MTPDSRGRVFLSLGDLYLPVRGTRRVVTVLGSCVAVALRSEALGTTALCHGVMPRGDAGDPYYVDGAIAMMLDWFRKRGAAPPTLEARVFGGATPEWLRQAEEDAPSVGAQNVQTAHTALADAGVAEARGEVGGTRGRRLWLEPDSGEVRIFCIGHREALAKGLSGTSAGPGRRN